MLHSIIIVTYSFESANDVEIFVEKILKKCELPKLSDTLFNDTSNVRRII